MHLQYQVLIEPSMLYNTINLARCKVFKYLYTLKKVNILMAQKLKTTINQKEVCLRHHRATSRKLNEVCSCSQQLRIDR